MSLVSALVPVATAAFGVASREVAEMMESGVSFAQLLKTRLTDSGPAGDSAATTVAEIADRGPDQTPLGDQLQWDALRQHVESLRAAVERQLLPRLAELGVDLSEPAMLVTDSQGRLLESGGHWERAKIEQLLADDPALGNQVRQLLQQASALNETRAPDAPASDEGSCRLVASSGGLLLQVI